jgi:cell division protein FtsB
VITARQQALIGAAPPGQSGRSTIGRLRPCTLYVTWLRVRPLGSHALPIVFGIVIFGMTSSLLVGPNGLRRLRHLRGERQVLAERALVLMDGNGRLRDDIRKLQRDPEHLERVARRELQRVRPNEVVYRFARPSRTSP